MKRRWWSIALELLLWAGIAVAPAVVLVMLSEELLPANF